MLEKHNIVGRTIVALFESQNPESVTLDDVPLVKDWVYYRWYIQLDNRKLFHLRAETIELLSEVAEPTCKPTIAMTRWITGAEYFTSSRLPYTPQRMLDDLASRNPHIRDHLLLSESETENAIIGQQVTAIVCTKGDMSDSQIVLVLNERNHLGVYDREGGNSLQLDELGDLDLDSRHEHEWWHDFFDEQPCDIFGRVLPS
jgi:hypothetical protein